MKKKVVGILVCTLLIAATVLPVARTGESDERKNNESSSGMQPVPTWGYHFKNDIVAGGCLMVWATENCRRICPALFMGYIDECTLYSGVIPDTISHPGDPTVDIVNDIIYEFVWDYHCNNLDSYKYAAPTYGPGGWELVPIGGFILENYENATYYPNVALCDPPYHLYTAVRADVILENPPIVQDEYYIEDGICEDLPGYLIGTTPITFNSQAGPDENPFETTPFTGMVINVGEVAISPHPLEYCPEIEIQTGTGIGASAIIRNTCTEAFTNLVWSMVIEGNIFYPPGGTRTGSISSLAPGAQVKIKSGLVLGFGHAVITVTVDDCEPVSADATIRLFLVSVQG